MLGRTVRELESSLDSAELSEWMAFHRVDPLPDPYFAAGIQASTMANLWSKGPKTYTPADFLPTLAEPRTRQSDAEMRAAFVAIAQTHNASLKRGWSRAYR